MAVGILKTQLKEKGINPEKLEKFLGLVENKWKAESPGHFILDFVSEKDGHLVAIYTFAKDTVPVESALTIYEYEKWLCIYCHGNIFWAKNKDAEAILQLLNENIHNIVDMMTRTVKQ
jgi:hypothetical protein